MIYLPRRALLALVLAGAALPAPGHADQAAQIRAPVADLYAALETQMRAGHHAPFRQRFDQLAPVIDRVFDLDTILQVSVGLRWSGLDLAARAALRDAFRRFTIASYVANFDNYEGERFEILPDLRVAGNDRIVQSRIVASSGEPIRMDYVMRERDGAWRVTDVLLDGSISRVAVQRSDFRGLLARGGASDLIASLQRKIAELSGGALGS